MDLFVARAETNDVSGFFGRAEEGEDIKVTTHDVSEVVGMLAGGRLANATTLIAVQWLALNYERLKRKWEQI